MLIPHQWHLSQYYQNCSLPLFSFAVGELKEKSKDGRAPGPGRIRCKCLSEKSQSIPFKEKMSWKHQFPLLKSINEHIWIRVAAFPRQMRNQPRHQRGTTSVSSAVPGLWGIRGALKMLNFWGLSVGPGCSPLKWTNFIGVFCIAFQTAAHASIF